MNCDVWSSENHIIVSELYAFMNESLTNHKEGFQPNVFIFPEFSGPLRESET
jgi:hypothetical protein